MEGSPKLLTAVALVAAILAAAALRYGPPSPRPAHARAEEFSAGRARQILRELVGEGQPHPTGSAAGARVRQKIVAELERLEYRPEVQEAFACGTAGTCARVSNVLARLDGRREGKAVLLSVHYDSVPGGPGASDDGMGVAAALEIAGVLRAGTGPTGPVMFLFNEGEEDHLLGAEAFVARHPWAKEVGAVVNLEARGTTGASLMFETSEESGWLIGLFARSVARPASNSIYYTVYKMLPNDTDLTVYKRHGLAGLNFAFIGGEARYHTPRDDFEHADPGSLQHHGDNALAMVRALSEADLESPPRGEAVFFDVLALGVVRWPLHWMPALAITAALLWLLGAGRAVRRGELRPPALSWGLAAFLVQIAGTGVAAVVAWSALFITMHAAGRVPPPWVAHPAPARAAFLTLPVLASGLVALWPGRRAGPAGVFWGTWAVWVLASLVTAFTSPGLSYPFVLPCLVAGICGVAEAAHARWLAFLLPLGTAALLCCPIAWLLYDALGIPSLPLASILLALTLTTATTALTGAGSRTGLALALSAAATVAIASSVAVLLPAFTPDNPRKLNLSYRFDADRNDARWLATSSTGPLPRSLAGAAAFGTVPVAPLEWAPRARAYSAPAPVVVFQKPELAVVEQRSQSGTRRIHTRLRSQRGADVAGLAVPGARVVSVRMNGVAVPEAAAKNRAGASLAEHGSWRIYICTTTGSEGVDVELEVTGDEPLDGYVWDASPGLPREGDELLSARPEWAVPFQTGDRTLVTARVRL